MKKMKEDEIYEHLRDKEKGVLLFKNLIEQDDQLQRKVLCSGGRKTYSMYSQEPRRIVDILSIVGMTWAIDFWRNQAMMGGTLSQLRKDNNDIADAETEELTDEIINALQINQAMFLVLDKLEADYQLDKAVVYSFGNIPHEAFNCNHFLNDSEGVQAHTEALYKKYSDIFEASKFDDD